jgi:pyruvate/2-oxoglutarate dehydrogenase complex dihydrolipoamide acyltransferase (E2) component
MTAEVLMPQLGETVAEGKILAWFKSVGDVVAEGDNLFEIETDKVTMEVPAIAAGPLSEIRVPAGETAKIGAIVAVIGGASGYSNGGAASTSADRAPTKPAQATRSPFEEVSTATGFYGSAKAPFGLRITPLARRLIKQNGADLQAIARAAAASGSKKIAAKDVLASLKAPSPEPPALVAMTPAGGSPEQMPAAVQRAPASIHAQGNIIVLNSVRRRTGERLAENWRTIPHVFQAIEVDFTGVEKTRSGEKGGFKRESGYSLTYLPFVARAAAIALRAYPQVNARLDGSTLVLASEINLGIAIDLSHDGLVVPVVRNSEDLTVPGLARAIGRLIDKARAGRLTLDDHAGGTYSISNNGAFGTTFTAPIINAPQVAILSVDAIRNKAAVVETAEGAFVTPRLTGMVGQSFDHRAFDGAYSAAFLSRLKAVLEERDWSAEFN